VAQAETNIPRFRRSDWITLDAVAEHMTQVHGGVRVLAQVDIQDALKGGCGSLLQSVKDGRRIRTYPPCEFWRPDRLDWVNALNLLQRLADFLDRPWPWVLRVALTAREREILGASVDAFLHRADAVRWGLWPEAPQARPQQQTPAEPPPMREEAARAEPTRYQRDRTIEAMKTLFPPDGIRPRGRDMSIRRVTEKINKLSEFSEGKVSEDTVRLADKEIKAMAAMKKLFPPNGICPKDISIAALTDRINNEPEFQGKPVSEETVRNANIYLKAALEK
jgi:hypothetical protein